MRCPAVFGKERCELEEHHDGMHWSLWGGMLDARWRDETAIAIGRGWAGSGRNETLPGPTDEGGHISERQTGAQGASIGELNEGDQ